jgi:hypothetical protein
MEHGGVAGNTGWTPLDVGMPASGLAWDRSFAETTENTALGLFEGSRLAWDRSFVEAVRNTAALSLFEASGWGSAEARENTAALGLLEASGLV